MKIVHISGNLYKIVSFAELQAQHRKEVRAYMEKNYKNFYEGKNNG